MRRIPIFASAALLVLASSASLAVASVQAASADRPVVIMGSGDIAESGTATMTNATSTGDLIRAAAPTFAFTLGDEAYPDGSATDYSTKYDPTWGSFKSITKSVPGNHEYTSDPPSGYLGYFGAANVTNPVDGGAYYAWDIGNGWRGYALNSEIDMSASSAQVRWLKNDLAANPDLHYLAMWHQPRFTSLGEHGPRADEAAIWDVLVGAGTDIVMQGHNHFYERFAKMNGNGAVAATGIRSFIAGAGGNQTYPITSAAANSQFHNDIDYGVLKLTLHANSYDWGFVESGRGFQNSTHFDTGRKGVVVDSGTDVTNKTVGPSPTSTVTTTSGPPPTTTTAPPTTTTTSTAPPTTTTTTTAPPTTTTPPPTTTTAPPATVTKHFVANESGAYSEATALGYNVHDIGMSAGEASALPAGTQGMAWVGVDGTACPAPSAAFKSFVTANASNPKLFGYYLMDEPANGNCVASIKAHADYIHAQAPGKKAFIVLTDWPGTYGQYAPSKTDVDLVGLDPYPCHSGTCTYSEVAREVNAAEAAGIPLATIAPTFQDFGGAGWDAPTAAQLQLILSSWKAVVPDPQMDYAYSWSTQSGSLTDSLGTRTDWQSVMSAHNSLTAPSPTTTTPPPAPTTTTPPPPPPTTTTTPPPVTTTTPPPVPILSCPFVLNPVIGQTVICTYK
jgi:hypothetical protein